LSAGLVRELRAALADVTARNGLKVVVLLGLPEVFCAGASRDVLEALVKGEAGPDDLRLAEAVLHLPVPTIAAMEGHATGGGLALGVCADIVIIARESRYGCSFMNMGFTPGMGTTRLLEHILSPAVAHELMYTGELRRGAEFEGRSGFNYILPRDEVRPKALDLAARIAEKPAVALAALKRVLALPRRRAFESAHALETIMHGVTLAQPGIQKLIEENYAQ
ncbi:MAG TPA: polyketide synthase, partial [Planctomycetota bacterium]|nr:polyketide synthase [Planctomycetota bacterium]